MSKQLRNFGLICVLVCFGHFALAQIIPVGSGSYTTTFPGTDEAGRNGFPPGTPQLSGDAAGRPVPTNDWWSKVILLDHADNLFNYPMAMKTVNEGLVVTYIPWGVIDDIQPIVVGVSGLNESRATVSDYSDWTVTMNWNDRFNVTSGIAMPFLYFEKGSSELASVTVNSGSVTISGEILIVTNARNGGDFVVYAPSGSVWTKSGSTYTSTLNGDNYWSMVMLPQNTSDVNAIAADFQRFAYVFPTGSSVDWSYDESSSIVRTDFNVTTEVKEGSGTDMLMGLLPHQWGHLARDSPQPGSYIYNNVRGKIKILESNSFSVENSYKGILPTLPYLSNYSDGFDLSALADKIILMENDQLATWTDSYNEGQMMNRLIQTARIADKIGMIEARDKMIATIKKRLEDWLTAEGGEVAFIFYYNKDWTAMFGYPAGHGQDVNINDHHFHWGYFIHAAAFLEQYEPGWAELWGPMIDLLVRDAASPDRKDSLFPFLRNFSPYAGHCWANGFASFPQGNDQESTSESMQFNSSLIHWGEITGNIEIRDLGIYLYTTEQSAVEEYWFDHDEQIFPENQYSLVSRVWGNSWDNGTFWTSDIEASYGIELYPIHGGSMYLGHNIAYVDKLWAEIEGNTGILSNDDNVNLWHDTMWKYLAFTDPEKAIDLYDSYPDRDLKFGISDAQTYYWIHAMNAMGQVDASVTADYPIAVAFQSEGINTYAAHNYTDIEIDVAFSDGFVLTVPAHTMATNRDIDISGEISASFSRAYPGGSVDLTVNVTGGAPSKVEFYDGGVLIGEDLTEPFTWKATGLAAQVHGFYAKIYMGKAFEVSNIVSVTVGEQVPYNGSNDIPGTIEPGHFDVYEGGKGQRITYADTDTNNRGDFRLEEAVDVTLSQIEGTTVGWISSGEWIEYTVDVATSGLYEMSYRFASGNKSGGGPFHLELNGESISDDISLTYTGDWDTWQTRSVQDLAFPEGTHILRLVFDNGEFNLGRMTFTYKSQLPYSQPIADAGENVVVILPETTAKLDGSLSSDPEGDRLFYKWEQIYGASVISFSDPTIVSPEVSNLQEGVYKCMLTVNDGEHYSSDKVLIIVSETGNSAPNVSITSPDNNASFKEGEDIHITARASDLEGAVTKVEFFDEEVYLGEDNTEPFGFTYSGALIGRHTLTAVATDSDRATGTSAGTTVSVNEVLSCSVVSPDALEGSFSVGYEATFESVGNNVTVTFELLDTDKTGVVAFLREESPFSEVQMDHVSGNLFTRTLTNRAIGENLRLACKFAFTGGLAVTKYLDYQVGADCGGQDDTTAPTDFTASVGEITFSSVELLLNAIDDSGSVTYTVSNGPEDYVITGTSGIEKSVVINGLDSETSYSFSVEAKDLAGNVAINSPIDLSVTTVANTNTTCSGKDDEAQQGTFEVGYNYGFETDGTNVIMTFELQDDKDGVIAYLWRETPFQETSMTHVSGKIFTGTVNDQAPGTTISYACKFAFAGGLAVTKYFQYEVGDDCTTGGDTNPPTTFTGTVGNTTTTSIQLLLTADDDSGKVFYEVSYGEMSKSIEASAGVEQSLIIDGLNAGTTYDFSVRVSDLDGNEAINSPFRIQGTTEPLILGHLDESLNRIKIYPNPVKDKLTIEWQDFKSVEIFSLSGKKLIKSEFQVIDTSQLESGMYFIIVSGIQSAIQMKLLKN